MAAKNEKGTNVNVVTQETEKQVSEQSIQILEEEKPKKKRKVSELTEKRNAITFDYMVNYISQNAPKDKKWFKEVAFDEEKKYKHFAARKAFINKYMPELAGQSKDSKWERVKDW